MYAAVILAFYMFGFYGKIAISGELVSSSCCGDSAFSNAVGIVCVKFGLICCLCRLRGEFGAVSLKFGALVLEFGIPVE